METDGDLQPAKIEATLVYNALMDTAPEEIATVRIELADSESLIWREVEVPSSISLKTLHAVIQAAFGWENYHLWEFSLGKRRYGPPSGGDWERSRSSTQARSDSRTCSGRAGRKLIIFTTLATAGSIA